MPRCLALAVDESAGLRHQAVTTEKVCMRIFINALSARLGGGQTYLLNLLKHVPQEDDLQVFVLVQPTFHLADMPQNVVRLEQASLKNPLLRAAWEGTRLVALLKELKIDLFFSPGGLLPRLLPSNMLTAVTFQNMLPFDHAQRKRFPLGVIRFRLWLLQHIQSASFRNADLVIFISMFAKSVIDLKLSKRKGQSVVIPHGLSEHFFRPQSRPVNSKLPEEYVLYVSILDFYKAQVEVVKAWAELRARRSSSEKLLLIGPDSTPYGEEVRKAIIELGLQNEVLVWGNVPYADIPTYYQHAKVNIFASSCENCPYILLEALAGGRPVLCSAYQPMPEFGADAVTYFDPYKPDQLADTLIAMLDDPMRMAEMGKRAQQRARDFDLEISARRTWEALFALANKED